MFAAHVAASLIFCSFSNKLKMYQLLLFSEVLVLLLPMTNNYMHDPTQVWKNILYASPNTQNETIHIGCCLIGILCYLVCANWRSKSVLQKSSFALLIAMLLLVPCMLLSYAPHSIAKYYATWQVLISTAICMFFAE